MVNEREALAGHPFADAPGHERAALSHRLPAQTGERHDPKDFGHGQLLEDRLVVAGRELDPIAIERALLGGARRDRFRMEAVDAHGEVLGVARADVRVALNESAEIGHGRGCVRRHTAGVGHGILGDLDLRRAGGPHALGDRRAHGADRIRLGFWRRRGGLLVERRRRGDGLGIGNAGPLVVGTARPREGRCLGERAAQVRGLERVHRHDPNGFGDDRADRRVGLVGDRVLVDRAVRVARDGSAAPVHVDVRLVRRHIAQCLAQWRQQPIRAEERHSRTSMGTSRKRAWAAP